MDSNQSSKEKAHLSLSDLIDRAEMLGQIAQQSPVEMALTKMLEETVHETENDLQPQETGTAEAFHAPGIPQKEDADQKTPALLAPEHKAPSRKTKPSLNRTRKLHARFTDVEYDAVQSRVAWSGLQQGEFIRRMLLDGKINVRRSSYYEDEILAELTELRAGMGSLGGLLLQLRALGAADKTSLLQLVREVQGLGDRLKRLEDKMNAH